MFKVGDIVIYNNYKKMEVVGIIIPNTVFEIKDRNTNKVIEVSYKNIKKI